MIDELIHELPRADAGGLERRVGGTTVLRVCTALVGESDRRVSEILGSRLRETMAGLRCSMNRASANDPPGLNDIPR